MPPQIYRSLVAVSIKRQRLWSWRERSWVEPNRMMDQMLCGGLIECWFVWWVFFFQS